MENETIESLEAYLKTSRSVVRKNHTKRDGGKDAEKSGTESESEGEVGRAVGTRLENVLREFKYRLKAGHNLEILTFFPFLLDVFRDQIHPNVNSNTARQLAASCLLTILSILSAEGAPTNAYNSITSESFRILSKARDNQRHPISSWGVDDFIDKFGLVEVSLRLINTIVLKEPIAKDKNDLESGIGRIERTTLKMCQDSFEILASWCYFKDAEATLSKRTSTSSMSSISSSFRQQRPKSDNLNFSSQPRETSPNNRRIEGSWRSRSIPSESEGESDSTMGTYTGVESRRHLSSKIRYATLNLLQSIITTSKNPKLLHPHFHIFFPFFSNSAYQTFNSYTGSGNNNLFNLVASDTSSLVRLNACRLAKLLLEGSESYLKIAEDPSISSSRNMYSRGRGRISSRASSRSSISFISLSERLGGMVREIHSRLYGLLLKPYCSNYPSSLIISMLSLTQTVILNSPYQKMQASVLSNLLKNILSFIEPLETNEVCGEALKAVRVAMECSKKCNVDSDVLVGDTSKEVIMAKLLKRLAMDKENEELIWTVIFLVAKHQDVREVVTRVRESLKEGSTTETKLIQLRCISSILFRDEDEDENETLEETLESELRTIQQFIDSSAESSIKSASCTFILSWNKSSNQIFQKLKVLTLDENSDVKVSAIRHLGFLFDKMESDAKKVELVDFLLMLLNDPCASEVTKYPLTWALANITDTESDFQLDDTLTLHLTQSLLLVFQSTSSANVQGNIVRSLGCIFSIRRNEKVENKVISEIFKLLETCLCSEVAKVRWNTAHALSKIFTTHSTLPSSAQRLLDIENICKALIDVMMKDKIYKARIQAVCALEKMLKGIYGDDEREKKIVREKMMKVHEALEEEIARGEIPQKEIGHVEELLKKVKGAYLCDA